jgi:hypothetical protein
MIMKRYRNAIYKCPSPLPLSLEGRGKKGEGDIGGMRDGKLKGLKGCYR